MWISRWALDDLQSLASSEPTLLSSSSVSSLLLLVLSEVHRMVTGCKYRQPLGPSWCLLLLHRGQLSSAVKMLVVLLHECDIHSMIYDICLQRYFDKAYFWAQFIYCTLLVWLKMYIIKTEIYIYKYIFILLGFSHSRMDYLEFVVSLYTELWRRLTWED